MTDHTTELDTATDQQDISLVLVDEDPLRRMGIRTILEAAPRLRLVGEAHDMDEACELAEVKRPDVLVVDSGRSMDRFDEIIPLLSRRARGAGTVVICGGRNPQAIRQAFECGASAFIDQSTADERELVRAIQAVAAGLQYVDPRASARLVAEEHQDDLTEREREVVRLLALGYRNREIASQLYLSVRTVESHRAHAMSKLRLDARWQLVRWALDTGLISASLD